jgi:hypothetical protein
VKQNSADRVIASNDHVVKVETTNLSVLQPAMKTEQEPAVLRDGNDQSKQLKILPSKEFDTLAN